MKRNLWFTSCVSNSELLVRDTVALLVRLAVFSSTLQPYSILVVSHFCYSGQLCPDVPAVHTTVFQS